jgi:hypothetical protein
MLTEVSMALPAPVCIDANSVTALIGADKMKVVVEVADKLTLSDADITNVCVPALTLVR